MIKRQKYMEPIREFYDGDLIKVITGIRRCGKSVILKEIMEEIRERSDNIIFLDFEDKSYYLNYNNLQVCITDKEPYDGMSCDWTYKLPLYRVRTNSDTDLTYCFYYHYIIWGGFPKRIEYSSESGQRIYLNELNETIILNDIINRYRIRKTEVFKRLANFVFLSNGRIFSARSVEKYMKGAGLPCSVTTITKYIGYLEEAYAIETVKRYSAKSKRELEYYLKVYNEDVALNSIRVMNNRFDLTHNFEMGYNLQVFYDGSHEIDFVADRGNKQYYIQVAYSVAEEKAYEREFGAFAKLDNSCQKIVITNDDVDFSTSTVRHIQFRDFVQMDEL